MDYHPLPRIEDLFYQLGGNNIFAKLDLSHAYQQCELEESSRDIVTITTQKGLYRYTRLPFGIKNAPPKFQKIIDDLLKGLKGVVALLDDVCIGAKDLQQLKERITKVLDRLRDAGFTPARRC